MKKIPLPIPARLRVNESSSLHPRGEGKKFTLPSSLYLYPCTTSPPRAYLYGIPLAIDHLRNFRHIAPPAEKAKISRLRASIILRAVAGTRGSARAFGPCPLYTHTAIHTCIYVSVSRFLCVYPCVRSARLGARLVPSRVHRCRWNSSGSERRACATTTTATAAAVVDLCLRFISIPR